MGASWPLGGGSDSGGVHWDNIGAIWLHVGTPSETPPHPMDTRTPHFCGALRGAL